MTTTDVEAGGIRNPSMDYDEPPPPYNTSYAQSNDSTLPPPAASTLSTADDNSLPPSYDSLYGQVRAAKHDSSSILEFFKKCAVILLNTVCFTVSLAILLAIPISMITIGSVYVKDCRRQPYIPIYLIVGGCFAVVKVVSNVLQRIKNRNNANREEENTRTNPIDGTLTCFLLAWFIAGNVWIYGIYGDFTTDSTVGDYYCNATLYYFAFWTTTAIYIVAALLCCCMCFSCCLISLVSSDASAESSVIED